jgi:hypothetical protein
MKGQPIAAAHDISDFAYSTKGSVIFTGFHKKLCQNYCTMARVVVNYRYCMLFGKFICQRTQYDLWRVSSFGQESSLRRECPPCTENRIPAAFCSRAPKVSGGKILLFANLSGKRTEQV